MSHGEDGSTPSHHSVSRSRESIRNSHQTHVQVESGVPSPSGMEGRVANAMNEILVATNSEQSPDAVPSTQAVKQRHTRANHNEHEMPNIEATP
ncbi:10871_t:CDS:1, partial [Acaulospora colombiana]